MIDYSENGSVMGYECLNESKGVDLSDLPNRDELTHLFADRGVSILEVLAD